MLALNTRQSCGWAVLLLCLTCSEAQLLAQRAPVAQRSAYQRQIFDIGEGSAVLTGLGALQMGQYRQARSIAEQLLRDRDESRQLFGRIIMARAMYGLGQTEHAADNVATLAVMIDEWVTRRPAHAMALARYYYEAGDLLAGMRIFDRVGSAHQGLMRAAAAEGLSDGFLRRHDFVKAQEWLDYALRLINQQENSESITFEQRDGLRLKRDEVARIRRIVEYGAGFVLYEEARALQLQRKHEEAFVAYQRLLTQARRNRGKDEKEILDRLFAEDRFDPDTLLMELPVAPVFEEAATLYQLQCMVALGHHGRAMPQLESFVNRNRQGLYRGEALQLMGDIALEHRFNTRQAINYYTQAIEWFSTIREIDAEMDEFQVPDKARSVTLPPPVMKREQSLGGGEWSRVRAGDILNRQTSHWYVDYQWMLAQMKRSLCYFIDGQPERAQQDLAIILELDPHAAKMHAANMPGNYGRLRDGYRLGKLFVSPEELRHFSGRARTALLVADFYYETEHWGEAEQRYRRLLDAGGDQLSDPQRAYLTYVIANCRAMQGDLRTAQQMLEKFKTEFRNTPTWPRAAIVLTHYYPKLEDRIDILLEVAHRARGHDWGEQALVILGQNYIAFKRYPEARQVFERLAREAKAHWRVRGAKSFLEYLDSLERS